MHEHDDILVALVGQPNSGKSTVFNYLTGLHQTVANYPGVTVCKKSGHYHEGKRRIEVVDLPGTYSLTSYTQEERVTRDFLLLERPEVVVLVIDAANLRRHLYLAFQLRELQVPLVICLNMMDIAQRRGFQIDVAKLEKVLGVPVVPTIARFGSLSAMPCKACIPQEKANDTACTPAYCGTGLEALRYQISVIAQKHDHELAPDWKIDYGSVEPLIDEINALLAQKPPLAQDFPTRWLALKLLENAREARRIIQHHLHEPGWEELLKTCSEKIETFGKKHFSPEKTGSREKVGCRPPGGIVGDSRLEESGDSALPVWSTTRSRPAVDCLPSSEADCRPRDSLQKIIASKRNDYAEHIEKEAAYRSSRPRRRSDRADKILCHPIAGLFCVAGILFLMFSLAFNLADGWNWLPWVDETGAFEWQTPMGAVASLFDDWIPLWLDAAFALPDGDFRSLLYDGIIAGVGGVLVFVPVIFFIFLLISALEQTGYMARVVVVMDRLMRQFGLHGHSIVPMLLAGGIVGGCAVPAVMATRAMREQRERLLTIMILPLMNCGAKIPVYALLIAAFFSAYRELMLLAIILISWSCAMLAALLLGKFFVKGTPSPLLIELPAYQLPMLRDVFRTAGMQTWWFLKRAGTIILLVTVILWALMYYPRPNEQAQGLHDPQHEQGTAPATDLVNALDSSYAARMGQFFEPVSRFAGFDWRDNVALIGGFAAKEVIVSSMITMYEIEEEQEEMLGASPAERRLATRLQNEATWTPWKAFAILLFVMIYSPCLATCVVIWRETGRIKYMLAAILYTNVLAFCLAVGVYQFGRLVA
ncbi:MAG: ferrous iron transporter B [Planctomycetaceae bacterium]|nr:ferrous iron transporter B [Planctomycetaceae bacterium]